MYKILEKKDNTVLVEMDIQTFENIELNKIKRASSSNSIEFESFSKNELKELMSEGKKSYDSICNSLKLI